MFLIHRETGYGDVVEIVDRTVGGPASVKDVIDARAPADAVPPRGDALMRLAAVAPIQWRDLAERAVEPNGYYLPEWELAVNAFAAGRTDASALGAWDDGPSSHLIGLLPVISMMRAYRIPLPALVSAHPYGTLCTPPLDRDVSRQAASRLMQQARSAGAHALILRDVSLEGAALKAFADALRQDGLRPRVLRSSLRACLDATRDSDELLREALGPKKLKELRRQRHRLAGQGAVRFDVARTPEDVAAAVETFLTLEASGWKGARCTALLQNDGDAKFVRHATAALAATGQCEIVTLRAGDMPVAGAIVLRHQDRAFYFKIGVDERFAKFSPGVQLTLELTRHLCADPAIATADSTASPDHPMINPIWRGRLAVGDVLLPLRPNDPVVALIHAAMVARNSTRAGLRDLLHRVRDFRK